MRHVLRQDDQAKRKHPYAQDRKKGKQAADNEQGGYENPDGPVRGLPQPMKKPADGRGKVVVNAREIAVELGLHCSGHVSSVAQPGGTKPGRSDETKEAAGLLRPLLQLDDRRYQRPPPTPMLSPGTWTPMPGALL